VQIARLSNIGTCESQLREIVAAGKDEPLKLPTRGGHLTAGGEVALVQLIITWAQRAAAPHLQTYITSAEDTQVESLSRRLYGLSAVLCAKSISGVRADIDVTASAKDAALERLKQLQSNNPKPAYRGPSIEIVCADHIGRGAPYLLYNPSPVGAGALRSRSNFQVLAAWLARQTIPKGYSDLGASDAEALGGMLYEIFKNTEDHALTDRNGDRLKLSIRAIKTAHLSPAADDLERIVGDFEPLATYCAGLRPRPGGNQVHLFEFSILDSGPGFAQSWTKRPLADLNAEEEETAVKECFGQGSAKPYRHAGQGLPHVIRLLRKEGGFLRLRTGRLSLFADFSQPADLEDADVRLEKWNPPDGGPLTAAAGTLITILIPMRRAS